MTLGPVPCQACRRFVSLVRGEWRDAVPESQRRWGEKRYSKTRHDCPALVESVA